MTNERKFTAAERRRIAERYRVGASSAEIAAELMTSFQAIERVLDEQAAASKLAKNGADTPKTLAAPIRPPSPPSSPAPAAPSPAPKSAAQAAGEASTRRAEDRWPADISPAAASAEPLSADRKFAALMAGRRFDQSSSWSA